MLATHLLINDPGTPPDVLTWLGTHDLNVTDALTLATRQDYPAGAPLNVQPLRESGELAAALKRPALPAHHRHAFITATNEHALTRTITTHDCFTPDELTAFYATVSPGFARGLFHARALAVNTATPTPVAAEFLPLLHQNPDKLGREGAHLTDIVALNHHLTPTTREGLAAAATDDPLGTYAHYLANIGRTQYPNDGIWWDRLLSVLNHPTFTTAALTHATTHSNVTWHIHFAIAANSRMPEALRRTCANAINEPAIADLGPAADPGDLHPDQDTAGDTAEAIAWYNPNVTVKNLYDLHAHATNSTDAHLYRYLGAIALHPRTPHDLRATAAAALTPPPQNTPPDAPLAAFLVATHAAPTTALDAPWHHLHGRFAGDENTRHLNHWARQAWAHAPRPATTLEYAQALTALDRNQFTGTMRELLTTAEGIASSAATTRR